MIVIAVMTLVVEPETLRNLKKPQYSQYRGLDTSTGRTEGLWKMTAVAGADFGYGVSGCKTMHGLAYKKDLAQISKTLP